MQAILWLSLIEGVFLVNGTVVKVFYYGREVV